ncbi:hypothetical protein GCM10009551_053570 [Nocardiopsis tropica]|uniref:hypothetical protein n=1 Tax=Tsukamurella strandjordii TaxID=147577 RepID=UPI0031D05F4D
MRGKAQQAFDMSDALLRAVAQLREETAESGRTTNDHHEVVITLDDVGAVVDVWLEAGITSKYAPEQLARIMNEQFAVLRDQYGDDVEFWDRRLYELLGDFRDVQAAADAAENATPARQAPAQ